ncbi:uncharacterized protein B0H64DRAFT_35910 [Chaetomium fimeti]|uniref:Uncharacterized protein n=1 Tax=Chaetomium fimeti TaxID=1854472 RepID=A0AAE0HRE1_9PEZI|nr:hypothetical protein B0H64DRAFT_35910 [Chaetomium fimeti]
MSPPTELERPFRRRSSRRRASGGDGSSGNSNREGHDDGYPDGYHGSNEEASIDNTPSSRRPSRRDRRPGMSRGTAQPRVGNQGTLLGCLAAIVMAVAFWAWRGRGWAGDPRVNIRVSKLQPRDMDIVASPSPLNDFITVAETAMNASLHLFLPHRTSNITFALDAPGLRRVDVASWLPSAQVHVWVKPPERLGHHELGRPLKAEHAPLVVSLANATLTLELMEKLWPVLLYAAKDLLVSSLPPEHSDYHSLNESLAEPWKPELISLVRADQIWRDLYNMGRSWPLDSRNFLLGLGYDIKLGVKERTQTTKGRNGRSSSAGAPKIGSAELPDPHELLQKARRYAVPGYTLPRYLASLRPPSNASIQLDMMLMSLTRRPTADLGYPSDAPRKDGGLWMGFRGPCHAGEPLRETAEGRCRGPGRGYVPYMPYHSTVDTECLGSDCIPALRDALCDAEEFLSAMAAAAGRVKAAVAEERGTKSRLGRLFGHFHEDETEKRIQTLDRALAAFHALYPALQMQRRLLAGVAARLQHACILQDALRDRVRSALSDKSWWWDLEWDADRRKVVLAYAMLPEIQETLALLKNVSDRIEAEDTAIWELQDPIKQAARLLKTEVSAGWIERIGLGNLQMAKRPVLVKPRRYPHF